MIELHLLPVINCCCFVCVCVCVCVCVSSSCLHNKGLYSTLRYQHPSRTVHSFDDAKRGLSIKQTEEEN